MTLKLNFMKGLGYMLPLEYLQMVEYLCNLLSEHRGKNPIRCSIFFQMDGKTPPKKALFSFHAIGLMGLNSRWAFFPFNHRMGKNTCHCLAIYLVETRSPEHLHQGRLGESFCNQIVASLFWSHVVLMHLAVVRAVSFFQTVLRRVQLHVMKMNYTKRCNKNEGFIFLAWSEDDTNPWTSNFQVSKVIFRDQ